MLLEIRDKSNLQTNQRHRFGAKCVRKSHHWLDLHCFFMQSNIGNIETMCWQCADNANNNANNKRFYFIDSIFISCREGMPLFESISLCKTIDNRIIKKKRSKTAKPMSTAIEECHECKHWKRVSNSAPNYRIFWSQLSNSMPVFISTLSKSLAAIS